MNCGRARITSFCLIVALTACSAWAQPITVINPGGEAYPNNPEGNLDTNIPTTGIDPLSETGWRSSIESSSGRAVQALDRGNAAAGDIRLAMGATNAHVTANPTETAQTAILYQELSHVVAAGQEFVLNFQGRGFFDFTDATDDLASFFGYLDAGDMLVNVNEKAHTTVVQNAWTSVGHSYIVPVGSPLIGENLVIGFYTKALDNAGFSSIDEVTLALGPGNPACDADGSGFCDFADVEMIANNFLNNVPTSTLGDLDDNGIVNFADFRIWKSASGFGGSFAEALAEAGAPAVPEPATMGLLGILVPLAFWKVRRRHRG